MEENNEVVLDGQKISKEKLQEVIEKTSSDQRIVEKEKDNFHTLTRMKG